MPRVLTCRDAVPSDAPLLREWDGFDHVRDSDPDDEWDWEAELAKAVDWRAQWIFLVDGRPMGCVKIIDPALEESHYWGDIGHIFRRTEVFARS